MIISEIFHRNWKPKDPTGQRLNIELTMLNVSNHDLPPPPQVVVPSFLQHCFLGILSPTALHRKA